MPRQSLARASSLLALAIAAVAILIVLLTSSSSYVLHARFYDAGQLVGGDLVTVAGHQVGSVGKISLAPDGLADVELDISDHGIVPIRSNSLASIGQLSLTGVANRFVGLTLSSAGRPIASGGALPITQTRGIVDLDTVLNALTPRVRVQLQQILRTGAYFIHQPTANGLNQLSQYLNPAFSQSARLGADIVADKFDLDRLVASTATVSTALAGRSADLAGAVTNTAAVLRELASQRVALADAVSRAPAVLRQSRGVLADVNYSMHALDPVLVDLRPVAPRLARLLTVLLPAAQAALPTIQGIQALVPGAKAALLGFVPVADKAIPAINSLTSSLKGFIPILAGLRPYAPDTVAGFFNGVGGAEGGYYDANGHYLKARLNIQAGGASLTGLVNALTKLVGHSVGPVGPLNGGRSRLVSVCPGGGNPPAWDRSNPWTSPDVLPATGRLCNPANDQRP